MGNIMRMNGSRVILLTKAKLIARITENEKKHIAAYNQAVKAYKIEALKQLVELTKAVKAGDMSLRLNLTTPVDNRKNYAKIREMFEWDNRDEIELEQQEFNEYVLDETEYARHAQMSNSMYLQVLSDAPVRAAGTTTRKSRKK
jgi:HAMP domain-containing protein